MSSEAIYYIQVNPFEIKVQTQHLQGQLIRIVLKCPVVLYNLYFKVQGKSTNLGMHDNKKL